MWSVLNLYSTDFGWSDLRRALREMQRVAIVAETDDLAEALQLAERHNPDAILMPSQINNESIVNAATAIRHTHSPGSRIAVLARGFDPDVFFALLRINIDGYLLWSELSPEDLWLLRGPIAGVATIYSPTATRSMIESISHRACLVDGVPRLSTREFIVLRGLAGGQTRAEIAQEHRISLSTIQRAAESLRHKFDVQTTAELLVQATLAGLIP